MPDQPPRASTVEFEHVTKRYDAGAKNTPGDVVTTMSGQTVEILNTDRKSVV